MNCKLYANIGIGHENNWETLQSRIISAAQCNADAIVINKSTPHLLIPDDKKYVALDTPWGTLPYIEVAKKSELSVTNVGRILELTEYIGIPIVWSVTDSQAAEFVKEYCDATIVKLHHDAIDVYELSRFCKDSFDYVIYHLDHKEHYDIIYNNHITKFGVYYTTSEFPPEPDQIQFSMMDNALTTGYKVGYEGREAGIFPTMALGYRGVEYIEKYLGEPDSDNPSVLTPEQFNDLFQGLNLMQQAHGQDDK